MPAFFPRQTIAWHLERAAGFRGLTLSVVESGLLTGVILRLLRAMNDIGRPSGGWWVLGYAVIFGVALTGAAANVTSATTRSGTGSGARRRSARSPPSAR